MKKVRIIAAAAVLVLVVGGFLLASRGGGSDEAQFRFAEVERGDLESSVSATGQLSAVRTVQVGTQVSGQITEIYADFNDRVKRGQLLARIDPTLAQQAVQDAQAGIERAQAALLQARRDYDRNKPLFDRQVITASEFNGYEYRLAVAQADIKSAQVTLQRARRNLGYTEIYAPTDGVIVERNVDVGQTVAASFSAPQLFLIAEDLSQMQILASVDEADIGSIHDGQPVRFTVQTFPDERFSGTVRQVRLQSTTTENVVNYTVVVAVDNAEGKLRPGMTATVDFETGAASGALLVPNSALRFTPTDEQLAAAGIDADSMKKAREARRGGAGGAARGGDAGAGNSGARGGAGERGARGQFGRLWVVDSAGKLSMLRVRTGLTDGKSTVVEGNELKEGMQVVVGSNQGSGAGQQSASPFGGGQQQQGRGRGPGF